jgi:hypothetical protein
MFIPRSAGTVRYRDGRSVDKRPLNSKSCGWGGTFALERGLKPAHREGNVARCADFSPQGRQAPQQAPGIGRAGRAWAALFPELRWGDGSHGPTRGVWLSPLASGLRRPKLWVKTRVLAPGIRELVWTLVRTSPKLARFCGGRILQGAENPCNRGRAAPLKACGELSRAGALRDVWDCLNQVRTELWSSRANNLGRRRTRVTRVGRTTTTAGGG